jgi:ABC-2 type transport system ATP-binding protein
MALFSLVRWHRMCNGAGKTTAVRILTTLAIPDAGRATVAGYDVVTAAARVRRNIGVTAQDATLDELLTGRQNLVMIGRLSGLRRGEARTRATSQLEQFGLDEPTTGLDPTSRMRMWEVIRALVADGATLMLTTQYLDEADELADRIIVVDRGRVIAGGTPRN